MSYFVNKTKIGILGGGQLGKMLAQSVSPWDVPLAFMDADKNMAAGLVASNFVKGNINAYADVMGFGSECDVLGIEIEHVNVEALSKLESEGVKVFPRPRALQIIKDKGLQKEFYNSHDFPTSPFSLYKNKNLIMKALDEGRLSYPFVQKARKGGYDGKGVVVIRGAEDKDAIFDIPSVIEKLVDIRKEVSVIACRDAQDNVECFPVVEMEFDSDANLVKRLICPVDISEAAESELHYLSKKLIRAYEIEGLLAIEFFIDSQGYILINEVAPRPHNSGHHTIESMNVSQFNQHMRAMLGLPIVAPKLIRPAVMINLLGAEGYEGEVVYENIDAALQYQGVYIHLYGKKDTRPFRKMGHITIVKETIQEAVELSEKLQSFIKVKSK